jgi:hypothetical protein
MGWHKLGLALAMLLPLGFLGGRRRRWRTMAAMICLILLLPIGCGISSSAGSGPTGGGNPPPPNSTYKVVVTGSMPGLNRTVTTEITVN